MINRFAEDGIGPFWAKMQQVIKCMGGKQKQKHRMSDRKKSRLA